MPLIMTDYLVTEFTSSLDNIIFQPIQQTQRIKYTTYDVSTNFIIFGASSGGLYIFNRHPCSFIKLIPSTEGSVVCLSISYDEKFIAVATVKGSVWFYNNLDSNLKDILIYKEHQGNIITAMKWNLDSTELYSGDNTGKLSVVVINNFIPKTMFQSPCTTLMQLDSRIVQIDLASRFLLVSTLTRVYLCDSETEHYRQIGKKLRDGEFGACFFGSKSKYIVSTERRFELRSFRILSDKESFTTYNGLEDLKIFCARPGSRTWEVQINGTVIRTHQFKHAFLNSPNNIVSITADSDCRLSFKSVVNPKVASHNFTKMFILNYQFILTYHKNGLYLLDPENASVVFWTNIYEDILEVRAIKKYIYIWTSKYQLHVLLFSTVEDFIVKSLLNKNYLLCADLCIYYRAQIKKILPVSKKIYLLSNLSEKLLEINATELNEKVTPVLNMIREFSIDRQTSQKLSSGIFVVGNEHFLNSTLNDSLVAGSSNNDLNISTLNDTITKEFIENILPSSSNINEESNKFPETTKKFYLLYEEYELTKINHFYRSNTLERILSSCLSVKDVVDYFIEFKDYIKSTYPDQYDVIKIWCYDICFKHLESNKSLIWSSDEGTIHFLQNSFEKLNWSSENACKCGFPLPNASLTRPKYYKFGRDLIKKLWTKNQNSTLVLCSKVPYLWKYIIKLREHDNINILLPIIIQFGDEEILKYFLVNFTYDLWNEFLKKFILLKNRKCLICEQNINIDNFGFNWNMLASEMVKSIGGENTVFLLTQHANYIPKSELNIDFYQSCIFTTILDKYDSKLRNAAVSFVQNINKNDSSANIFGKLLEKNLLNPDSMESKHFAGGTCFSCNIPLQSPVLGKEKFITADCGHNFHSLCYKCNTHICNKT